MAPMVGIHSFSQQAFIEISLCARHCNKFWGYKVEQNEQSPCPQGACIERNLINKGINKQKHRGFQFAVEGSKRNQSIDHGDKPKLTSVM